MFPKTSAYVKKVMMNKLNECIFWLKMMAYLKNIILFEIKSVLKTSKHFIKTFLAYFFIIFLQHFSNRPYSKSLILVLLWVLHAENLSSSLDFSNESLCIYAKLKTLCNKCSCFLTIFTPSKRKFYLTISDFKSSSLASLLLSLPFFSLWP